MLRVGLTGGPGAGKSTVAAMLAEEGFPVLDADRVAHELYVPGSPLVAALAAAFGGGIRSGDGGVDRRALGRIVFGDPKARAVLDALVHPPLLATLRMRLDAWRDRGEAVAVLEAALLLQWGPPDFIDFTVCVTAPREVRRRRLTAGGLDAEAAEQRLDAVAEIPASHPGVDRFLSNDGDREALRREVAELAAAIRQRAGK